MLILKILYRDWHGSVSIVSRPDSCFWKRLEKNDSSLSRGDFSFRKMSISAVGINSQIHFSAQLLDLYLPPRSQLA